MNPAYETHSINRGLVEAASHYPTLEPMATGGGVDFIVRFIDGPEHDNRGPVMVLTDPEDIGIDDLDAHDRAEVVLYFDNEDWNEGGWIAFMFETATEAIAFMATFTKAHRENYKPRNPAPGTLVKYRHPAPGEEKFRFRVVADHGDRIMIELQGDDRIKPVEVVMPDEVAEAAE